MQVFGPEQDTENVKASAPGVITNRDHANWLSPELQSG
jgi:hypothetical protein